MQPKRGWWRIEGYDKPLWIVGEVPRFVCPSTHPLIGVSGSMELRQIIDHNLATYLGDGPEPVEPVQLCLGWWERADGGIEEIVADRKDGPFRWANRHGSRWNDNGQFSRVLFDYIGAYPLDLVKRRPDLDQPTPDAKDAEIERLTEQAQYWQGAYNALRAKIDKFKDSLE